MFDPFAASLLSLFPPPTTPLDKGTPGESRGRKATGPRLLRDATRYSPPDATKDPTTAEPPKGSSAFVSSTKRSSMKRIVLAAWVLTGLFACDDPTRPADPPAMSPAPGAAALQYGRIRIISSHDRATS